MTTLLRMDFVGNSFRQGGKARDAEGLTQAVLPGRDKIHSGCILGVKLMGPKDGLQGE